MTYITRYNIDRKLWEVGYWVNSHFYIVCSYPNV